MKNIKRILSPDKLSTFIYYSSILTFIIAFNFSDHGSGGWQQQFMPFLSNKLLADIIFLDSLTGYAVTGANSASTDTNYIIKTTNSGDNWNIVFSHIYDFDRIQFLNKDTGYASNSGEIFRSTNAGLNWNSVFVPPNFGLYDMFAISYDTIWISFSSIGGIYIYRTTNAGVTWTYQLLGSSLDRIYFFNNRIGFCGSGGNPVVFYKTTNSGDNWINITGERGFRNINFIDSLTGFKCNPGMKKTTDGGISWLNLQMPSGGLIINSVTIDFSNINIDTTWGVGGVIRYPNNMYRGILYKTTNGGKDWNYQIPDTAIPITQYYSSIFNNKFVGWAYAYANSGIHTTIGGDTNFITSVNSNENLIPDKYYLYQNYPNPFNPNTKINFSIPKSGIVTIKIYDILGKEVITLVNEMKQAGNYDTEFFATNLASGIYFCRMESGEFIDIKRMVMIK